MRATPALGARPNPLHAIMLAFPVALFCGAVATDIAYLKTEEMQWSNFSAWLITPALVFTGLILAWAIVLLALTFRSGDRLRHSVYAGVLGLLFVVGLVNAFQHSRDAWSSVGAFGLTLSVISAILALAAAVIAHSTLFSREVAR